MYQEVSLLEDLPMVIQKDDGGSFSRPGAFSLVTSSLARPGSVSQTGFCVHCVQCVKCVHVKVSIGGGDCVYLYPDCVTALAGEFRASHLVRGRTASVTEAEVKRGVCHIRCEQ